MLMTVDKRMLFIRDIPPLCAMQPCRDRASQLVYQNPDGKGFEREPSMRVCSTHMEILAEEHGGYLHAEPTLSGGD